MSIHEIINTIKNADNIKYNNNYFFGNYSDYLRCGNSYIKLLSEAFPNHSNITKNSIVIYINDNNNDNEKKYKINYIIKFAEVHWTVLII
jgi:effector-binding domain-containing protein